MPSIQDNIAIYHGPSVVVSRKYTQNVAHLAYGQSPGRGRYVLSIMQRSCATRVRAPPLYLMPRLSCIVENIHQYSSICAHIVFPVCFFFCLCTRGSRGRNSAKINLFLHRISPGSSRTHPGQLVFGIALISHALYWRDNSPPSCTQMGMQAGCEHMEQFERDDKLCEHLL